MNKAPHFPRWFFALFLGLVSWLGLPVPVTAAESLATPKTFAAAAPAPVLVAGLKDYIIGNRSRMIQFTFIGFAIGVAILMTATRKH